MKRIITAILGGTFFYLAYLFIALTTTAAEKGPIELIFIISGAIYFFIIGAIIVWASLTHGPGSRDLTHLTILGLAGPLCLLAFKLYAISFSSGTLLVWSILSFIGGSMCLILTIPLNLFSIAPSLKEIEEGANDRLESLKKRATRLGYRFYKHGTYSASPYIRQTRTNHVSYGRIVGQTTGTMDDTWVRGVAKSSYGFFLSDSKFDSEYGIQLIRFENLLIIVDSRNNNYYVYQS